MMWVFVFVYIFFPSTQIFIYHLILYFVRSPGAYVSPRLPVIRYKKAKIFRVLKLLSIWLFLKEPVLADLLLLKHRFMGSQLHFKVFEIYWFDFYWPFQPSLCERRPFVLRVVDDCTLYYVSILVYYNIMFNFIHNSSVYVYAYIIMYFFLIPLEFQGYDRE